MTGFSCLLMRKLLRNLFFAPYKSVSVIWILSLRSFTIDVLSFSYSSGSRGLVGNKEILETHLHRNSVYPSFHEEGILMSSSRLSTQLSSSSYLLQNQDHSMAHYMDGSHCWVCLVSWVNRIDLMDQIKFDRFKGNLVICMELSWGQESRYFT